MGSSLVKIASCGSAPEADQIRILLEQNGVKSFLDGANVGTVLTGTGLGGVRVLVSEKDAPQARQILDAVKNDKGSSLPSDQPWYCGACQEEVASGFDVCWSCGGERREVEKPHKPTFDPPAGSAKDKSSPDPKTKPHVEAAQIVDRAWRAAVVGLIFLPILLHFYSMYLLVRASLITNKFSPATNRRYYWTWAMNVVGSMLWAVVFLYATR